MPKRSGGATDPPLRLLPTHPSSHLKFRNRVVDILIWNIFSHQGDSLLPQTWLLHCLFQEVQHIRAGNSWDADIWRRTTSGILQRCRLWRGLSGALDRLKVVREFWRNLATPMAFDAANSQKQNHPVVKTPHLVKFSIATLKVRYSYIFLHISYIFKEIKRSNNTWIRGEYLSLNIYFWTTRGDIFHCDHAPRVGGT